jgi:hypothetical protein
MHTQNDEAMKYKQLTTLYIYMCVPSHLSLSLSRYQTYIICMCDYGCALCISIRVCVYVHIDWLDRRMDGWMDR